MCVWGLLVCTVMWDIEASDLFAFPSDQCQLYSFRQCTAVPIRYVIGPSFCWSSTRPIWWSGIVVSALALINEVNQRRSRLVLRRVTMSGFNSRCRTFISVFNQPATPGQLSLPSLWGSVNEYQLRLGRQRQVWFIPLADERGCAGKTVRSLENACHTWAP